MIIYTLFLDTTKIIIIGMITARNSEAKKLISVARLHVLKDI